MFTDIPFAAWMEHTSIKDDKQWDTAMIKLWIIYYVQYHNDVANFLNNQTGSGIN